ncbi:MAG: hypothetical protein COB23_06200 [Methylophaga sp.]|nr:MAG: hypothetical protein COB23_06200 [Methylophaga sp.]
MLATTFLSISASLTSAQAATDYSFSDQLEVQKEQLRPQEFNFFSDRYKQVKAHNQLVATNIQKPSFKEQLDSQMQQLKGHQFHPASDAYYQIISR